MGVHSPLTHGSSPLTRGALSLMRPGRKILGIIPAHAGSTSSGCAFSHGIGDHPRSRGEHQGPRHKQLTLPGSSPLTRGAPQFHCGDGLPGRIIPAHAGSTGASRQRCRGRGDHPRSRGEHYGLQYRMRPDGGSSPLTRGAPHRHRPFRGNHRIIPAHAGRTPGDTDPWHLTRDHPRSRGEDPTWHHAG